MKKIKENLILKLHFVDFYCRIIIFDLIQLHFCFISFIFFVTLILMNMRIIKLNVDDVKSQLNQREIDFEKDLIDIFTQTLWEQVETNNKFAFQILETFRNETRHHSKISFVECEKRNHSLYFRDKKYVFNFDRFRLRIIQCAHDNIIEKYSKKVKCYELVNRVYWWFNIYKYVQRFVRNCHICSRFKFFRQRIQKWLRFLFILERQWRDVFMNYVNFFSINIFMNVIYRYIFVFVDRLIKMRHLIFIVIMKIKKIILTYYFCVWKHYDLFEFFVFDRDTQFTFDVWRHFCQMLRVDVKYFIAYYFEIDEQIERFNVIMKHYFRTFVNYMQNDWIKWLLDVEFAINNVFSIIIFVSLFLINSSQNFRLEFEFFELLVTNITIQQKIKFIDVENFIVKIKSFNNDYVLILKIECINCDITQ